jgi:hypothetical protein
MTKDLKTTTTVTLPFKWFAEAFALIDEFEERAGFPEYILSTFWYYGSYDGLPEQDSDTRLHSLFPGFTPVTRRNVKVGQRIFCVDIELTNDFILSDVTPVTHENVDTVEPVSCIAPSAFVFVTPKETSCPQTGTPAQTETEFEDFEKVQAVCKQQRVRVLPKGHWCNKRGSFGVIQRQLNISTLIHSIQPRKKYLLKSKDLRSKIFGSRDSESGVWAIIKETGVNAIAVFSDIPDDVDINGKPLLNTVRIQGNTLESVKLACSRMRNRIQYLIHRY